MSYSHVALTVSDLALARPWWDRFIGAEPAIHLEEGGFVRGVYAVPSGQLLGLTQHGEPGDDRFDPHRTGLDHVGFACASRDEVEAWKDRLDELGVDHGGIVDAPYGSVLSFADPDGNQLDFTAIAG